MFLISKWRVTSLTLCVCFLLASCGLKDGLKKRYFEDGKQLYAQGKYREASLAFRKAIQKDSEFGEAYYHLGLSELKPGGDMTRAVAALRRAMILLPYHEDSKIKLAEIYISAYLAGGGTDQYPIAEAKKISALLLTRNQASYHGLRLSGHVAALENRYKDAIESFRKADALKPGQTDVLLPLAQALAADSQVEASEKLLRVLLERDKSCSPAYDLLYGQYMAAKRTADAEAILKARLASLPADAGAVLRLAGHYFRRHNPEEMQKLLARLAADSKTFPHGPLQAGDFCRGIGRIAEARQHYQAGLALNNPDKLEYQKRLANVLLLEGKRDEAMAAYAGVARELPKDQESRETHAALLLEKDVDAALQEFEALIKESPNDPTLRYNIGQAYMAKRDFAQARLSFLESSHRQRTFLLPRIALAQMSLEANQFKEVQQYAAEILAINPESPEGRFYRCAALTGLGKYTDTRRELNKLGQEFPQYSEVHLELAFVDLAERKFSEAEARLRALYGKTKDVRALNGLADVYLARDQPDRALELVAAELKKEPGSQRIRLLLAQTEFRLKKYAQAIEHFLQLANVDPNWDYLYLRIGEAHHLNGDLGRAVAAFRKAGQLSPRNLEAALRLAYALEVAGQYKDAIAAYREALAINPNVPIAMNNLAYLLAEHGGDLAEALRLAHAALQRLPQQRHISDTVGWITLRQNQPGAALQIFNSLVRKYPEEVIFRYHLAVALSQTGDRTRARSEAQVALQHKPAPDEERKIRDLLTRLN